MKPVAQMALAHVYVFSRRKEVTWSEVVGNLNKVDWSFDNDLWFNILLIGSKEKKMITGKESIRAAGLVISYLVMGDHMTQKEIQEVRDIIRNARNSSRAKLPEMVVGGTPQ